MLNIFNATFVLDELFWAKDIIILFTEHGNHGLRAWLDVYHGMSSSYMNADRLTARAGSIQAAVILELNVGIMFPYIFMTYSLVIQ